MDTLLTVFPHAADIADKNLVPGFCFAWSQEIGNEVDNSASWLASQLADLPPR